MSRILIVEDSYQDCLLMQTAASEARLKSDLICVKDGAGLFDYLYQKGDYEDLKKSPIPDLILLDIDLPARDAHDALKKIKSHVEYRKIPVIAVCVSEKNEDVRQCYDLGVNSLVIKPKTAAQIAAILKTIEEYWMAHVELPQPH